MPQQKKTEPINTAGQKMPNISQDSAATCLRHGGIFGDDVVTK